MMRVLLLNNLPAPYFLPLFRRLGEHDGWALTICFATEWRPDLGWAERLLDEDLATRTIYLDREPSGWTRILGDRMAAALALLRLLLSERPDYLICYGYTLPPQITLLLWALLTGTPFGLTGDANIFCDHPSGMRRWLKRLWLGILTRRAAAIFTIGTANLRFWERYGAESERLFPVPFAVDNDYFERESRACRDAALTLRDKYGLTGKVVFLSVGRLVERKRTALLIEAIHRLGDDRAALLIAGSGEERAALEALAAKHPAIIFLGGIAPRDLPLYYAMSDVMALVAHDEPWGLVTNEAMACGLAIIAHHECGSAVDLVDEENGIALASFEIDELVAAMRRLIEDEPRRNEMKEASRRKIAAWNIGVAAAGVIEAVRSSSGNNR